MPLRQFAERNADKLDHLDLPFLPSVTDVDCSSNSIFSKAFLMKN